MNLIQSLSYFLETHLMEEMANLQPVETGLKPVIFVSGKGNAKHGARIKVSNIVGTFHHNDNFTLTVSDNPEIAIGKCKIHQKHLEEVKDWVKLNKDHLLNIWDNSSIMTQNEIQKGFKKL